MSDREIRLLTDAHVHRFIRDGFLVLGLEELGAGFHENVYRAALERQPQSGLSDDLDAAMPELREVLDSATVRGALEGLLGRGYLRHPHSAAYVESGAPEAAGAVPFEQGWHRDSYWGVQIDRWSPNPKEQQAWTPKLLHATCLQTLGVMGQNAAAAGDDEVLRAVVECCVTCLKRPEPGGGNRAATPPDYPPDSILGSGLMSRQNAALALRMLGSHGAVAGALRQEVVDACR